MGNEIQMKIMCEGQLVNGHSDGIEMGYGWQNPLPMIPPIGSTIAFRNFDGTQKKYEVLQVEMSTQENFNNYYTNQQCLITVKELKNKQVYKRHGVA